MAAPSRIDPATEHDAGNPGPRTGVSHRRDGLAPRALPIDRALGGEAEPRTLQGLIEPDERRDRVGAGLAGGSEPVQRRAEPARGTRARPLRDVAAETGAQARQGRIEGAAIDAAQALLRPEQQRGAVRAGERDVDIVQRHQLDAREPRVEVRAHGVGIVEQRRSGLRFGQRAERAEQTRARHRP